MIRRLPHGWTGSSAAGLALLLLVGCVAKPPGAELSLGMAVPPLAFEALEGGTLGSADWRGRAVVLSLWATWCVPCRQEMPDLDAMQRTLDPARVAVVGVSLDDDSHLAREFALRYRIGFPLAIDPAGRQARSRLGSRVLPDTLLIAPDGRLADRVLGSADWRGAAMRHRVLRAAGEDETTPALPVAGRSGRGASDGRD